VRFALLAWSIYWLAALAACSKTPPKVEPDPRPEILRYSGIALPPNWKTETTENWMDGIYYVQITAPPGELRRLCEENHLTKQPARKTDSWLEVKESEPILRRAGDDGWELLANPTAGKATFIRRGPDKSGD